ncbi:MAG: DUF4260 domain-containing protein [Rubricoccaceae bacterium]
MPSRSLTLLRLEGLAISALAIWGFALTDASWWMFAALILAPDLGMLGYLASPKVGAMTYNAVHSTLAPALLVGLAVPLGWAWGVPVALVWAAHIGIDRALGYGLKSPESFQVTHLGLVGRSA